jgi:hypothetical protein
VSEGGDQSHSDQLNQLRGRQLAIIKLLPTEDALAVLHALPISPDEEQEILADIQQRHVLTTELLDRAADRGEDAEAQ